MAETITKHFGDIYRQNLKKNELPERAKTCPLLLAQGPNRLILLNKRSDDETVTIYLKKWDDVPVIVYTAEDARFLFEEMDSNVFDGHMRVFFKDSLVSCRSVLLPD